MTPEEILMFIAYVVLAFIVALILSVHTDRKALSFLLIFWIFTSPIFNSALMLKTPTLGFDLHADRILLFLLIAYLLFHGRSNPGIVKRPPFEKYIYIYLAVIFFSLAVNFNIIRKQNLAVVPINIMTFLVVYVVAKRHATEAFFEAIIKAILLMAVASVIIALTQIGINSDFLKTCDPRIAYGTVVRTSGIFLSEYELGYFLILACIIAAVKFKGSTRRIPVILTSPRLLEHL